MKGAAVIWSSSYKAMFSLLGCGIRTNHLILVENTHTPPVAMARSDYNRRKTEMFLDLDAKQVNTQSCHQLYKISAPASFVFVACISE